MSTVAVGRKLLDERPCTPAELGRLLAARWPDRSPASLAYAVRNLLPVVQIPPRGGVGRQRADRPRAAGVLGRRPGTHRPHPRPAGPAVPGRVRSGERAGRADLERTHPTGGGARPAAARAGDVPGRARGRAVRPARRPRPDPATQAPARYLYDFDNLLLSHYDRSRVVTDGLRRQNFDPHGPVPRLVLLDGFTAATWTLDQARGSATLTVRPFARLSPADRDALTVEGAGLLTFLAPKTAHEIRFATPS